MDDFAELAAEGFTAVLETDMGDQVLHFASNGKRRDSKLSNEKDRKGRSKSNSSKSSSSTPRIEAESDGRRPRRDHHHRDERKREEDSEWTLRSYLRSKRHSQRPASDSSRSRRSEAPSEEDWSRKSYLQDRRHQQHSVRRTSEPVTRDKEEATPKESPEEVRVWEQKCDQLRLAKSAYVPASLQPVPELKWEEERLYDDVGRAVREAMRKSGEVDRRRRG